MMEHLFFIVNWANRPKLLFFFLSFLILIGKLSLMAKTSKAVIHCDYLESKRII